MKRGLKLLTCGVLCMSAFAWKVNAEEISITDGALLETCVTKSGNTCTLANDIALSNTINITKGVDVTINLNGNDITSETETVDPLFYINNGSLEVTGKGTITSPSDTFSLLGNNVPGGDAIKAELKIGANVEVTSNAANCIFIKGKGAKADVYGKLLAKGEYGAIQGNGIVKADTDNGNTVINIYDGASVISENDQAIYHPQTGTLTVNGGTIEGVTGIEMRAGNLVVKGGTITATAKEFSVGPNGNGSTTFGAGIAIAQHTTVKDINVSISAGTIKGLYALYESDPNEVLGETNNNTISITGGNFEGSTKAIYSENEKEFITNGTFNTDVSDYFKATTNEDDSKENTKLYQVITTEGEVQYVVAEEEKLEEGYFGLGFDRETLDQALEQTQDEELKEILKLVDETLAKKYTAAIYYDIVYGNLLGDTLINDETTFKTELDKPIEVTLEIPTTLEKVKEGFTRKYVVIRIHENKDGKQESTIIDEVKENADGTVTFETDKFSTYVLAYEDTENTKNPKTGDNMLAYFATAIISVIGLMLTTLKITKKQK